VTVLDTPKANAIEPISNGRILRSVAYDGKRAKIIPPIEEKRNIDAMAVVIEPCVSPLSFNSNFDCTFSLRLPDGSTTNAKTSNPEKNEMSEDRRNGALIDNILINTPPNMGPMITAKPQETLNLLMAFSSLISAESAINASMAGQKAEIENPCKILINTSIKGSSVKL
jgi:hypothetical protein